MQADGRRGRQVAVLLRKVPTPAFNKGIGVVVYLCLVVDVQDVKRSRKEVLASIGTSEIDATTVTFHHPEIDLPDGCISRRNKRYFSNGFFGGSATVTAPKTDGPVVFRLSIKEGCGQNKDEKGKGKSKYFKGF
jgi:hypothetical protein